jgi:hypothetical protein
MRGPQNTYKVARNRGNERSENVSVAYNFVIKERSPIEFVSAEFVTELLSHVACAEEKSWLSQS